MDDRYRSTGYISSEELKNAINVIPALFQRIELTNNRIEYLNNFQIPGLGDESNLLLQNIEFSREIILEEDYCLFEAFIVAIKKRKKAFTIVRIKYHDSMIHWIKIMGTPDPYQSNLYVGYMLDVSNDVDIICHIDKQGTGIDGKIQLFENPVLKCDFPQKNIIAVNDSAVAFFGYTRKKFYKLQLENLFHNDYKEYQQSIFEEIIFHERWSGKLRICIKGGDYFLADVGIRPLVSEGQNLLWVSIYNISSRNKKSIQQESSLAGEESYRFSSPEVPDELDEIVSGGDLVKILSMLVSYQPIPGLADSILFSDIYRKEEIVRVCGYGVSFKGLSLGKIYPFEGTIAENILNYNLSQIIVEDTMKSIKPIDWALFIPYAVRSYFAYPFYDDRELRTVLIFCSEKSGTFNIDNVNSFYPLFSYFLKGPESWKVKKSVKKNWAHQ